MKKLLLGISVIFCILCFNACKKDEFADNKLNPLDPESNSEVLTIINTSNYQQTGGPNYYDKINFSYNVHNLPTYPANSTVALFRDDHYIGGVKWLSSTTITDFSGLRTGTFKYELSIYINNKFSKKSIPYYVTVP